MSVHCTMLREGKPCGLELAGWDDACAAHHDDKQGDLFPELDAHVVAKPVVDDLRALTLTQPWCGLMASGIKLLENRDRPVIKNEDVLKQPDLVLHASREVDESVYPDLNARMPSLFPGGDVTFGPTGNYGALLRDMPWYKLSRLTSAFLAVAKLRGALYIGGTHRDVVEQALRDLDLEDQMCFAFGPTIYIFSDVRPLAVPIPSKGKLGWWRLNDEQRAAVRAQVPR